MQPTFIIGGHETTRAELNPAALVDRGLRYYLGGLIALTSLALLVFFVQTYLLHKDYPRNTLLFDPHVRFTDFTGAAVRVNHFGDPEMMTRRDFGGVGYEVFPYPVPSVYPHLLYNQFSRPLAFYLATVVFFAVTSAILLALKLKALSPNKNLSVFVVLGTMLMPFPFLYLIDRGNLEGFVWILLLIGIGLFYRKNYTGSAVLLACAAAMKLFPALLFFVFIAKRKYYAFVTALFATVAFTVLSWAGVGPTIVQAAINSSASGQMLKDLYIVGFRPSEAGWDHSIMGGIKQGLYLLSKLRHVSHNPGGAGWIHVAGIETAVSIYAIVIPIAFVIFYWFRLFSLPVLNQLMAYLLLCVLLPFVSNEYTLVHVYLAWGAFLLFLYRDVRTGRVRLSYRKLAAILGCFAVIFSPQSYWILSSIDNAGGQIKMVALLILVGLVTATPMPSSSFEELPVGQ